MKNNIIKQLLMGILTTIALYGNTQPYVQTIAGSSQATGYSGDNGPAVKALFNTGSYGNAYDAAGNLYIADT